MKRLLVITAVLLSAESAAAQFPGGGMGGGMGGRRGGGMGGMGGGMDRGAARTSNFKFPSAKSLEKYNPAELVLDKHGKLKLDDAQQAQFKALRLQIFERNATLLARYDSLQRDFKPPQFDAGGPGGVMGGRGGGRQGGEDDRGQSDPAADSTRRAAMVGMIQLRQLVDSLLERRRTDVHDVLSALTDETQRKKAAEFLDKQDIDFAKEFPAPPAQRGDRGAGGEGGQGGMGRGGRRPPAA